MMRFVVGMLVSIVTLVALLGFAASKSIDITRYFPNANGADTIAELETPDGAASQKFGQAVVEERETPVIAAPVEPVTPAEPVIKKLPEPDLPETLTLVIAETPLYRFSEKALARIPATVQLALWPDRLAPLLDGNGHEYWLIAPQTLVQRSARAGDDAASTDLTTEEANALRLQTIEAAANEHFQEAFESAKGIFIARPNEIESNPTLARLLFYGLSGSDKALLSAGRIDWDKIALDFDVARLNYVPAASVLRSDDPNAFDAQWQDVLAQASEGNTIVAIVEAGPYLDEFLQTITKDEN